MLFSINLTPRARAIAINLLTQLHSSGPHGLFGLGGIRGKCYAVARGRKPGIYATADEALQQTQGFSNNCMRKFADRDEAERWLPRHACEQAKVTTLSSDKIFTGVGEKGKKTGEIGPIVEWAKLKGQ